MLLAATCAATLIGLIGCEAAQSSVSDEAVRDKLPNPQAGSTIPEELEYVPESYTQPAEHPGTLEKLEYQTWESLTYEDHTQAVFVSRWV